VYYAKLYYNDIKVVYIYSEVVSLTDKIQLCLRLPEEKISELKEEAKKQKRSVNNLLEVIIDEYLEKQKQN